MKHFIVIMALLVSGTANAETNELVGKNPMFTTAIQHHIECLTRQKTWCESLIFQSLHDVELTLKCPAGSLMHLAPKVFESLTDELALEHIRLVGKEDQCHDGPNGMTWGDTSTLSFIMSAIQKDIFDQCKN